MDSRLTASALIICLAFTIITAQEQLRCRCVEKQSEFIPPKRIQALELIPAGAHCEEPEVIITLKGGKHANMKRCVDPEAKWVINMITYISNKLDKRR
ncbi:hypothetical protein AGOR_G00183380 [Albula goreensis]|uniref:Chemokine interleukin-8-like domain-containing protein n=1 Tax=Albula goreensis TaxID=1534307 RepID=A0A8T3D0V5_9TELE|nr:hypothetical protein AGOR_G00183380 [Albula goreensis]